ncbi:MAG: hypothetical protein ACTSRU_14685 [Candidatus Hodarchaeales archaeon]
MDPIGAVDTVQKLYEARSVLKKKREKEKERRLEDIYDFLEEYPGQTAYSLSKIKSLKLNKETARLSLLELERRGDIELVEEVEQGRKKKRAYLRPLSKYYFTRFNEESLTSPGTMELLEKSREAGYAVTIIRHDNSEVEIIPGEDLRKKLS